MRNGCVLGTYRVWAIPRSLAATEGISNLISIPPGTEMFQFPGFASFCLCIQQKMTDVTTSRVSPFRDLRIKVRLATPRSISQPSTSFIASKRLGIHRKPLFTYLFVLPSPVSPRALRQLDKQAL